MVSLITCSMAYIGEIAAEVVPPLLESVSPTTRSAAEEALDVAEPGYALEWVLADLADAGTPVAPGTFDALIAECDRLIAARHSVDELDEYLKPLARIRYAVLA